MENQGKKRKILIPDIVRSSKAELIFYLATLNTILVQQGNTANVGKAT